MYMCAHIEGYLLVVPLSSVVSTNISHYHGKRGTSLWVIHYILEIAECLQQVKHKDGSRPPVRTLGMGDVTGDCKIFATCNLFQGF